MTNPYPDRLSEIKARLQAANLDGPLRVRTGYEGARHIALIDHGTGLEAEVVARTFEREKPWPRAELLACAPADLQWAVEEIDHLRRYIRLLGDLAYALDGLRWALENPMPSRVERRRRTFEEARQRLLATPCWREGECQGGCRHYATHVLVIEQDGNTTRESCCEECGSLWLAARRTAIDAGGQPAAAVRLEPIPLQSDEAKGVLQ